MKLTSPSGQSHPAVQSSEHCICLPNDSQVYWHDEIHGLNICPSAGHTAICIVTEYHQIYPKNISVLSILQICSYIIIIIIIYYI